MGKVEKVETRTLGLDFLHSVNAQSLGKFVVIPDEQLPFTGDVTSNLGGGLQ